MENPSSCRADSLQLGPKRHRDRSGISRSGDFGVRSWPHVNRNELNVPNSWWDLDQLNLPRHRRVSAPAFICNALLFPKVFGVQLGVDPRKRPQWTQCFGAGAFNSVVDEIPSTSRLRPVSSARLLSEYLTYSERERTR